MTRNAKINALLLAAVAALAVLPLALGMGEGEEEPFTGADGQAETAITENDPGYEPWFSPLYEPPSVEIESGLFALQAAIGAGVVAYCLGVRRGRAQGAARAAAGPTGPGGAAAAADARATAATAGARPAGDAGPSPRR